MYIARAPEEKFKLAVLAIGLPLFDKLEERTVRGIARNSSVSAKQLHFWKNKLKEEGVKIFSHLTPGRKKVKFTSFPEDERLLIYETINHLLVSEKKRESKNLKFSPEMKEQILFQREKLKEESGVTYETFAKLIGLNSVVLGRWSRKIREEGIEGLKNKSTAPKRRPTKLPEKVIIEITRYGERWRRNHRGRIKITEFSDSFRWKYRRLLRKVGKSNLSDKVIIRYLKEAELYRRRKKKTERQKR